MFPTSWFYSAHLDELFITKHIIYGRNKKNPHFFLRCNMKVFKKKLTVAFTF